MEKYAKSAQKMIIFESSLAVSEMQQAKLEVLYERMSEQYKARLADFDPVSQDNLHDNFTGRSYSFSLQDNHVEAFKKSIEEADGKKSWINLHQFKIELYFSVHSKLYQLRIILHQKKSMIYKYQNFVIL